MSYQEDRLTEIADAIRSVKGTTGTIKASNFAGEIESIKGAVTFYIRGRTTPSNFEAVITVIRRGFPNWWTTVKSGHSSIYAEVPIKGGDEIIIQTVPHDKTNKVVADVTFTHLKYDGNFDSWSAKIIDTGLPSTIKHTVELPFVKVVYKSRTDPASPQY